MTTELRVWLALVAGTALTYWQPFGGALLVLGAFAFEYLSTRHGEEVHSLTARLEAIEATTARVGDLERQIQEVSSAIDTQQHRKNLGIR